MNFKIFPCGADKVPLIDGWQQQATNDPAQIQAWQQHFGPRLTHWGIPCGESNHIYVLDVDVKGDNGFETVKDRQLPATLAQRTPSGGAHYFFKYPNSGGTYPNRVKFLPGLDTRSDGGYVLYYGADLSTPMADCPDWVWQENRRQLPKVEGEPLAVAPEIVTRILQQSLEAVRSAPAGESNHVLNTEAFRLGQLVASGSLSRVYAEVELFKAAKDRGKPDYEARRTIESGLNGGQAKPLLSPFGIPDTTSLPPVPPPPEAWMPRPFTREELFDTTLLRKPQLFEDWSTQDIQLMTADGGTGKTTLKLFEAVCLALGERFLGFNCITPGKTLFITGEDTAQKLGAIMGAIVKQMGIADDVTKIETILSSVIVKKDSDLCVISKDKSGFLHLNEESYQKVKDAVMEIKPRMVVFDPISTFWGSEAALNDMAKAVSKFMSRLVDQCGVCVEMINHMGKVSSSTKDMTQFAGRGGTGLPSHARVSRILRPIFDEEYAEITNGEILAEGESAILCNIAKFTDGSPLYNKPFLIMRRGYLFSRKIVEPARLREEKQQDTDQERVFRYIAEVRSQGLYPSKNVVIAYFMTCGDPLSEARVKRSLDMLQFHGHQGKKIRPVQSPDLMQTEKIFVITDGTGKEI